MQNEQKSVLITGAASGIGAASADYFIAMGYTVFGVDRTPMPARDGLVPFVADVTRGEELEAVRATLAAQGVTLSAILPMAGVHAMASLVEGDVDKVMRVMEVNFFGALLAVRALHSLLAERGRVVILTSELATCDPLPFNGIYNVSKVALESYAQALRQELGLLGQRVITIRPGAIATPLAGGTVKAAEELAAATTLYTAEAPRFARLTARFLGRPLAPERLAATVFRATTARHPRLSYTRHRHPGLLLLSLLPLRMQCFVVKCLLHR